MMNDDDDDDADVERAAVAQEARDRALQRLRDANTKGDNKRGEGEQAAVQMLSSIQQQQSTRPHRRSSEGASAKEEGVCGGDGSAGGDAREKQDASLEGTHTSKETERKNTNHSDVDESRGGAHAASDLRVTTPSKHKKRKRSEGSDPRVAATTTHGHHCSLQQQKEIASATSPLSPSTSNAICSRAAGKRNLDTQDDPKTKWEAATSPSAFGGIGAPTADIPAAFFATQAFVSARDFFVAPLNREEDSKSTVDSNSSQHVECTLCQVLIGSRAYTLKRHLYRHHPEVFRVSTSVNASSDGNEKRECGAEDLSESGDVVITLKQEPSSRHHNDGACVAKRNEAFVAWLRSEIIPMKAIQSETFRQFLSAINPSFVLPDVTIQPRHLISEHDVSKAKLPTRQATRFMKGFCLAGDGKPPKIVNNVVVPTPGADEALIRVVRAGICGTDLMMVANYKPGFKGVLGHEFVGIVEALGEDDGVGTNTGDNDDAARKKLTDERNLAWLGKRVVGEINIPCDGSTCTTCQRAAAANATARAQIKKRNHCPHRAALGIVRKDGVFAEFITLPLHNLFVVPDGVVDAHAVFAEPLAAACRIIEQQVIELSHDVAILGDGKLGLLCTEVLHALGAAKTVTLIGKHAAKLALMKQAVDATHTVDELTTKSDMQEKRFDVCVECTGTPSGASLALRLVKRGGIVAMKSTCAATTSHVDVDVAHAKQVRVIGSRCGPFAMALELLRDKRVDVQKFVHGVYPLERADKALAHAARRGVLKIQLVVV
ncbi:Glycoside hydrolase, partial [Globisporangium splendens]